MHRLVFLLACTAIVPQCSVQGAGPDIEMWNEADFITSAFPHTTLTVPLVLRDSFTLANPQIGGVGAIFDVTLNEHFTGTIGFLYAGLPNTGSGFNVNVPLGAVTVRQQMKGFEFADRSRAECLFGIPENPIRYRNKLVIEAPKFGQRWRVYVSDEVFYDFSQSSWSQNRLQAGAVHSFSDSFRLNLFYLERDVRRSHPSATHAVGVAAEIYRTRGTHRNGVPNEEN